MADSKSEGKGGIGIGALAGGVVGAFVAGLILAALAMMFLAKKKKRSQVSLLSFPRPSLYFPSLPPSRFVLLIPVHLLHPSDPIPFLHTFGIRANPRTETDRQTPWMDIAIPKSAQQHGDRIPTHPSPNPNQ
jgi:hypothetical protein